MAVLILRWDTKHIVLLNYNYEYNPYHYHTARGQLRWITNFQETGRWTKIPEILHKTYKMKLIYGN